MNIMQELGRNITRINAANPGNALKTIRVKCSCKQQLQAEIEIELDRHKAINIDILLAQSLADVDEQQYIIYTVTYSVFNKRGSLRNSLKAFEVHERYC